MDVRRLAAIDMHGAAGRMTRRRVILAEFLLGFAVMVAIGVWMVFFTESLGWWIFGVWFIGVGLNYLVLSVHAVDLYRTRVLQEELAGVDILAEARLYTRLQAWVFVPLAFLFFALRRRQRQRS